MNRRNTFVILLTVVSLIAVGCKKNTKVGEGLDTIEEQKQAGRLGEILKSPESEAGQSPAALGVPTSPPPKQNQEQQQQQQQQFVDLELLDTAPYFYAAGEPSCSKDSAQCEVSASSGTIMRIVNKDDNPRRYQSSDGTYDTGDMAPGASKQLQLGAKGDFQITDPHLPFAIATLQVF